MDDSRIHRLILPVSSYDISIHSAQCRTVADALKSGPRTVDQLGEELGSYHCARLRVFDLLDEGLIVRTGRSFALAANPKPSTFFRKILAHVRREITNGPAAVSGLMKGLPRIERRTVENALRILWEKGELQMLGTRYFALGSLGSVKVVRAPTARAGVLAVLSAPGSTYHRLQIVQALPEFLPKTIYGVLAKLADEGVIDLIGSASYSRRPAAAATPEGELERVMQAVPRDRVFSVDDLGPLIDEMGAPALTSIIQALCLSGFLVRTGRHRFAVWTPHVSEDPKTFQRRLLSAMSKLPCPSGTQDIAGHMRAPASRVRHTLQAMIQTGRVIRVGWGRYAQACDIRIKASEAEDAILEAMQEGTGYINMELIAQAFPALKRVDIELAVRNLLDSGKLVKLGIGCFRLAIFGRFRGSWKASLEEAEIQVLATVFLHERVSPGGLTALVPQPDDRLTRFVRDTLLHRGLLKICGGLLTITGKGTTYLLQRGRQNPNAYRVPSIRGVARRKLVRSGVLTDLSPR